MKTRSRTVRLILATIILGAAASIASAGPGTQYWTRTKPITTTKEADAVKPDATVAMVCGACKTTMIRDTKNIGPQSKGRLAWFTIGSKHKCEHCGGEISVVKGKTADSMQHNCSMCGEGAAFCCASMPDDK